jgi:hypothetical protein
MPRVLSAVNDEGTTFTARNDTTDRARSSQI